MIIIDGKKQFSDAEVIALAKAMNGPHRPLPDGAKFTMEQLRESKWSMLSTNERNTMIAQAIVAINYMVANYTVLEKDDGSRKETEDNN